MATEQRNQLSIDMLNSALAEENTASLQYMFFHFICEDKGYKPLAMYFKKAAIEEMKHAEAFAERILFLEGEVRMALAQGVKHVTDVPGMLDYARQLETTTILEYGKRSRAAAEVGDIGTHKIFQDILMTEESHMDQFRLELENAKEFGKEYLVLQVLENLKNA